MKEPNVIVYEGIPVIRVKHPKLKCWVYAIYYGEEKPAYRLYIGQAKQFIRKHLAMVQMKRALCKTKQRSKSIWSKRSRSTSTIRQEKPIRREWPKMPVTTLKTTALRPSTTYPRTTSIGQLRLWRVWAMNSIGEENDDAST